MDILNLHPLETRVILNFCQDDILNEDVIRQKLLFNVGQINQSLSWLLQKNIIFEFEKKTINIYSLTEYGLKLANTKIVEEQILDLVKNQTIKMESLSSILNLEQKDVGKAFGLLSKEKILSLDDNKNIKLEKEDLPDDLKILKNLLKKALKKDLISSNLSSDELKVLSANSKKRGASNSIFKISDKTFISYKFNEIALKYKNELEKSGVDGQEIGLLSQKILEEESWIGKNFRQYDVENVPKTKLLMGRKNEYCNFLEDLKDNLVNLGFEEFDGDIVQNEFWNCDALFMPQFHAARDIHDVYYIKEPKQSKTIDSTLLENVKKAHESGEGINNSRGWEYSFDTNFTKRLLLRSQGTVFSAKALCKAKVPSRHFGVIRCFRNDQVDRTHLPDFYQTEGIVVGEDVNIKTLLGLLEIFAKDFAGAKDIKYVPGYFPFTEPSIEIHIKHPELGWFELGGAGIFRPEVTIPQGINVPVIAWGIGIDRMALLKLGLSDLRDLFSDNIESVRLRRSNTG